MMYNVGETRWGDYEVGVGDVDVHPRWPGTVQGLKRLKIKGTMNSAELRLLLGGKRLSFMLPS